LCRQFTEHGQKANQRVTDFKSKDYGLDLLNRMIKEADNLSQSLKDKQSELEAAEMAQNTLKSNLDKLRAEYQQATRHNARGAGRKPEHTEQLERIMELHAQGLSHRAISEIVKVPSATVGRYIKQMNQK
jgi:DNA-binding NarL/FixJ family response regulator